MKKNTKATNFSPKDKDPDTHDMVYLVVKDGDPTHLVPSLEQAASISSENGAEGIIRLKIDMIYVRDGLNEADLIRKWKDADGERNH